MNRRRIAFLAPLFAVLAMLLGLTETASAAFNPSAQNPHYGNFLLQESEASGFSAYEIADPTRENGEWIYDGALGVPVYVRQNPWTMFDPLGLYFVVVDSPEYANWQNKLKDAPTEGHRKKIQNFIIKHDARKARAEKALENIRSSDFDKNAETAFTRLDKSKDEFKIVINITEHGHRVAGGDGEKMTFDPLPSAQDIYYSNNPDGKTYSTEKNSDEANIIHESRHMEDHQKGVPTGPKGSEAHVAAEERAIGDGNIWRQANNMRPRDSYSQPADRVPEERMEKVEEENE